MGVLTGGPVPAIEGVQLRLPPEGGETPALLSKPFREEEQEDLDAWRHASKGSGRWRWVLFVAVVIAAGAFGWKELSKPTELPPEALSALEDVQRNVLRDDAASQQIALEQLQALLLDHPNFIAARAEQALLFSLQIDDQRALADARHAAQSRLRMQIEGLERARSPGDWRNRINALRDGIAKHDQALVEIAKEETRLQAELKTSLQQLPESVATEPPEVQRAVARAQLFALAITGSPETMGMLERFRQAGGSEAWQTLAESTYLLHAPGIQPADAKRLRARLAKLKDADASWLRVYLLDARLARTTGGNEALRSNLDAVVVLNPAHGLAKELRGLLDGK